MRPLWFECREDLDNNVNEEFLEFPDIDPQTAEKVLEEIPYRVLVGHEYGGSTVEKRYWLWRR